MHNRICHQDHPVDLSEEAILKSEKMFQVRSVQGGEVSLLCSCRKQVCPSLRWQKIHLRKGSTTDTCIVSSIGTTSRATCSGRLWRPPILNVFSLGYL